MLALVAYAGKSLWQCPKYKDTSGNVTDLIEARLGSGTFASAPFCWPNKSTTDPNALSPLMELQLYGTGHGYGLKGWVMGAEKNQSQWYSLLCLWTWVCLWVAMFLHVDHKIGRVHLSWKRLTQILNRKEGQRVLMTFLFLVLGLSWISILGFGYISILGFCARSLSPFNKSTKRKMERRANRISWFFLGGITVPTRAQISHSRVCGQVGDMVTVSR